MQLIITTMALSRKPIKVDHQSFVAHVTWTKSWQEAINSH